MSCPGCRSQSVVIYSPRKEQKHLSDIRSTQPKNPSQTGHRAHALLHRQKEQGTIHLPSMVRLYLTAEFTVENSDPSLRILAKRLEHYKLSRIYNLGQAKLVTWLHLQPQEKDGRPLSLSTSEEPRLLVCVRASEDGEWSWRGGRSPGP